MPVIAFDIALCRLRGGDRVIVTHPDPMKATDKTVYTLAGGGTLTAATWGKLADRLEPEPDGLFPDVTAQTYRLKPGAET